MKTHASSKRGSALFIVLTIIISMSALMTVVVKSGLQQAFTATKLSDRIRAQLIAEAGAHEAYMILKADWPSRNSDVAFPATSYGGGSYDVTVAPTNAMASIRSAGSYGTATDLAILDVIHLGSSSEQATFDWSSISNYTVVSGGEITWTGASQFLGGGALHSNGKFLRSGSGYVEGSISSATEFETKGNSGGVDGGVTAPSINGKVAKILGSKTVEAVALVTIPNIDLTPFYNEALANGEVYDGDLTLSGGEDPDGGILWVNGDLSISGNDDYTGSYFATGDIKITGNGSLTAASGYPTLASRDGDVSFAGEKEVTGLIYVKNGDYSQTGGNILNGQIVVKGDVSKAGNSMVANYVNSPPTVPGTSGSTENILGLNAWQR